MRGLKSLTHTTSTMLSESRAEQSSQGDGDFGGKTRKGTRRAKNNQNIQTESSNGQTVTQRQGLRKLSRCFYLAAHREPICIHTSGGDPQSVGKQKGGRKNQAM